MFVTCKFYIFVTFNQYSLARQVFFDHFEPITCKMLIITSTPGSFSADGSREDVERDPDPESESEDGRREASGPLRKKWRSSFR
jgi:hypothetical protein